MKTLAKLVLLTTTLCFAVPAIAQDSDNEELKLAAIEALITAPDERAWPLAKKVLDGNHSDKVKEAALFVLSQIDKPEAQETLLGFAREASGELQLEAIRMIGIGGGIASSELMSIYTSGDSDVREAVLEAYMIAGNKAAVFEIAKVAEGDDFEEAVETLAVMGAREELRQLRSTRGISEALIDACAISGDFECLRELAADDSNVELQVEAIEGLGIIGGERSNEILVDIYKNAANDDVREAALDGMLISGHDQGLLEIYRAAGSSTEKKEILEILVMVGSDEVWAIIDDALAGDE